MIIVRKDDAYLLNPVRRAGDVLECQLRDELLQPIVEPLGQRMVLLALPPLVTPRSTSHMHANPDDQGGHGDLGCGWFAEHRVCERAVEAQGSCEDTRACKGVLVVLNLQSVTQI